MSLADHLRELRRRLIVSVAAVGLAAVVFMFVPVLRNGVMYLAVVPYHRALAMAQQDATPPAQPTEATDPLEAARQRMLDAVLRMPAAMQDLGKEFVAAADDLLKEVRAAKPAAALASDDKLLATNVTDSFSIPMKLGAFGGVLTALPVAIYQAWAFIAVALREKERRLVRRVVPASVALFFAGVAFAYWAVVPVALVVFMGFSSDTMRTLFTMASYLDFLGIMLLAFGVAFQLPLVQVALVSVGLMRVETFSRRRREAVVVIAIIAALLTPPDVLSQLCMLVPMYLLYEIGIQAAKRVQRKDSVT